MADDRITTLERFLKARVPVSDIRHAVVVARR